MLRNHTLTFGMTVVFLAAAAARTNGQEKPWNLYADVLSTSFCDVVNAGNTELVVLAGTGNLVIVTGSDVTLADTFVDDSGSVFFLGDPAGFIDFATDGDNFRSLWWLTLTGTVVDVDSFTGDPTDSGLTPADFTDVPCDACDFWDDPTVCLDDPPVTVRLCGMDVPLAVSLIAVGLMTLRLLPRSRMRPSRML